MLVDAVEISVEQWRRPSISSITFSPLAGKLIEMARTIPFTIQTWNSLLDFVGADIAASLANQLRSVWGDIETR